MSSKNLAKLLEPIMIGNVEVRNRIKISAMAVAMGEGGGVSDQIVAFYEERSKGGAGVIGISCTATELLDDPMQGLYDDKFIPDLKKIVDGIHKHGATAYAQMGVGYSWTFPGEPLQYVSPSGITATGRGGSPFRMGGPYEQNMPIELSVDQIHQIAEDYGDGARRAKEAGFDIVEIIPAVGYVLAQFMSPKTNKRTDEYGGSLENRMRIIVEVIQNMKKKTGGMPVSARISGDDLYPVGPHKGYSLDDSKEMAKIMESAGLDQIDVMAGWHSAPVEMIQTHVPQGRWLYLAEGIKSAVSIPVAGGTQLQDIMVAADAVASGKTDIVYMARANIAEPELGNKVKAGKIKEIRPCINCCRCQESADTPPVYCSVNPRVGREAEYPTATPEPAKVKKNVLVIGGGPSGMEAARIAAFRGHKVTIMDKNSRLGGAMLMASIANEKIGPQMRFKINEVKSMPIDVKLGTEVTSEVVAKINPDAVVVAVGGAPNYPDAPGMDKSLVLGRSAMEGMMFAGKSSPNMSLLLKLATPFLALYAKYFYNADIVRKLLRFDYFVFKKKPAILGGGFAGLEMGELLTDAGKKVSLIEEDKYFGSDIGPIHRWTFKKHLRDQGVPMLNEAKILEITDKGVKVLFRGKEEFVEADSVVPTKIKINSNLYEQLKGKAKEIYFTGDASEPGKLMEAISSGFIAGSAI